MQLMASRDPGRVQTPAGAPYAERPDRDPDAIDRALASAWSRIEAGPLRALRLRKAGRVADAALALAPGLRDLSEARLREEALLLRQKLVGQGLQPALIAGAFAMAREATRRHIGLSHHRVQLMGGAAMLDRALAEMETGEGKTITALLPAVLFALAGRPVHVVTVNDYLAQRDSEQLGPVYEALGLTTGLVIAGQSPPERRAAYRADVAYCTNKDLVFDYLRDRMALGARRSRTRLLIDDLVRAGGQQREALYLRGLHVAIVDEADSILVDEARTPLILSGPDGSTIDTKLYATALDLAGCLDPETDYTIDRECRALGLTPSGRTRLAELSEGLPGLWAARRAREELAEQALKALRFFQRGTQYVVAEGKVQIVDEYTGRVMPDRTWEHGLHQMVEAKEGCELSGGRRTIARITFQRFFARYGHLCGMTGTAAEARPELSSVFGLRVLRVPTHHTLCRRDQGARFLADADEKWTVVAARARALSEAGRAVLIGTRSVEASEHVAALLRASSLLPAVLNAQQSREEAGVVARAGQPAAITVATNMAGRGTDIRLSRPVREAGGLHVILTEYHESARIDRQLFGRCARQGDPGSFEAIVAADDEIFGRYVGQRRLRLVRAGLGLLDRIGWTSLKARAVGHLVRAAQSRAERMNALVRRQTIREDNRLERSLAFAGRGE